MPKRKSARADGRGGRLPGVRIHPDVGDWQRVRIDLCRLLDQHWAHGHRTARQLATTLGVSDRSVRRWMSGEDRPHPDMQERIREWTAEHFRAIRATRVRSK